MFEKRLTENVCSCTIKQRTSVRHVGGYLNEFQW